jgi:hypothetical protein
LVATSPDAAFARYTNRPDQIAQGSLAINVRKPDTLTRVTSSDAVWTVGRLAVEPRWDQARVRKISGRSRGDLLGPWGDNVVRRFGRAALVQVRSRLLPPVDTLGAVLGERDWVPAFAQLEITEAIVDELLGGDWAALYPLLVEDTRAGLGWATRALLRGMGPARALELAPKTWGKVQERGAVEVSVDGRARRARLRFRGAEQFEHPSWRILQLMAQRVMMDLAGSPGEAWGEPGDREGFVVQATW